VLQAAGAGGSSSPVLNGVQVAGIVDDPTPGRRVYDPGHPDADAQGYVTMPNVNTVTEMTDLITETRSYQANTQALQIAKSLYTKTLEVLK
jgi:flagellar basal-body rod protein FlgC